jgi:hypothetical protein
LLGFAQAFPACREANESLAERKAASGNFEPMRRRVEAWQKSELTDVAAKVVIYEAFVEGKWEAAKHLAQTGHERYFEPKYEEFKPRTIWSLSKRSPQLAFFFFDRGDDPSVDG